MGTFMNMVKGFFQEPLDGAYTSLIEELEEKIRNAQTEDERETYQKELNDHIYLHSTWW